MCIVRSVRKRTENSSGNRQIPVTRAHLWPAGSRAWLGKSPKMAASSSPIATLSAAIKGLMSAYLYPYCLKYKDFKLDIVAE